jgi:signal transduction histidine kinase
VLLAPSETELHHAATATDARGWPRWAVVACSLAEPAAGSHLIHLAPEDWTESALRLVFPAALRLQAMKALHAQLLGDMRTISRRVGHDLRGPLNSIVTTSEAMLDPDESPASPRAGFAESISTSVDDVMRLFERMSFVLKATTQPPPRQPVIMEEVVWGAFLRLESRLLKAGGTLTKPEKWPILEGVAAWLDVIWSNLLANSIEHAGPLPRIELGWEQLPDSYRFWVRDHGPGISAKQEPLLFHPMDRLSELNAPRGFGLPIVRRLVELQGGRCGYERNADGGATFYFTLPGGSV